MQQFLLLDFVDREDSRERYQIESSYSNFKLENLESSLNHSSIVTLYQILYGHLISNKGFWFLSMDVDHLDQTT